MVTHSLYDSWLGLGFQTRWGHSQVQMLMRDRKAWGQGHTKQWEGEENGGGPSRGGGQNPGQVRGPLLRVGDRGRGAEQLSRLGRDTQRDRSDGKDVLWPPEHFLGVSRWLTQADITLNNILTVTWRFRLLYNVINPSFVS